MVTLATNSDRQCLEAISFLQRAADHAIRHVSERLQAGMSERTIAELLRQKLADLGVRDYWYNLPIMVLIGPDRFLDMRSTDYDEKSPRENVVLQRGSVVWMDIHPRAASAGGSPKWWGNLAGTLIFQPDPVVDAEQIAFLKEMQDLELDAIAAMQSTWTGEDLARWFMAEFELRGIELVDVRGGVGHVMQEGEKEWVDGETLFLDPENGHGRPLINLIVGVEPAGMRRSATGRLLVARFETCVAVDPIEGPMIAGDLEPLPFISLGKHFAGRFGEGMTVMKETVARLQELCASSVREVMPQLSEGMSEIDIADELRSILRTRSIEDYWYDVPIIVYVGPEHFEKASTIHDYEVIAPQPDIRLAANTPVHVDFHPVDPETRIWGDWSTTFVFRPRENSEQLSLLKEIRDVQRAGVPLITAETTGADVPRYYIEEFNRMGVTLLDVRNNVGHSIHAGPKAEANRIWLDEENDQPLGECIFTIEPGGAKTAENGETLVARFEECIYIPTVGSATILGEFDPVPLRVD